MCRALAVGASGFHAWKHGGTPERKRLTDAQMLTLIGAIDRELKARLWIAAHGVRVARAGIPGEQRKSGTADAEKWYQSTAQTALQSNDDSKHGLPVAPNKAGQRNDVHLGPTRAGCILAVVVDLFNREVVGLSIKPRMTSDIVDRCTSNGPDFAALA